SRSPRRSRRWRRGHRSGRRPAPGARRGRPPAVQLRRAVRSTSAADTERHGASRACFRPVAANPRPETRASAACSTACSRSRPWCPRTAGRRSCRDSDPTRGDHIAARRARLAPPMGVGAGKTVLVVDDDASLRMLCRVNLELDGYRVLEAGSVATARQALEDESVDAMLLDFHLGDGDGRELLNSLGDDRPPVAFFTGSERITPELRAAVRVVEGRGGDPPGARGARRGGAAQAVQPRRPRRHGGTAGLAAVACRFRPVSATGVYTPLDHEERLKQYLFERSEEGRAV